MGLSCIFLIIIFALNSLSVRVYGESEYWFALIKVVTVIIFIGIGILTILGIMGGEFVGFDTFTKGDGPILGGNLEVACYQFWCISSRRLLIPRN